MYSNRMHRYFWIKSFLLVYMSLCLQHSYQATEYCRFGKEDNCTVQCHCRGGVDCDLNTGRCPNGCNQGKLGVPWTGPQCQKGNVAYKKIGTGTFKSYTQRNSGTDGLLTDNNKCVALTNKLSYTPLSWWYVDLNGLYYVYSITIYSYAGGSRLRNFNISIGNTSATPQVLFTHREAFTQDRNPNVFTLAAPAVGRFIRIQRLDSNGNELSSFCEVVVQGHKYVDCDQCEGKCDSISGCFDCKSGRLPQDCKQGTDRFGENGFFKCHCPENDTCDTTTGECGSGECGNQVFPEGSKWTGEACQIGNVALHKMTRQKGAFYSHGSHYAVDGIRGGPNGRNIAISNTRLRDGRTTYWVVDLEMVYRVISVTVFNVDYNRYIYQYNLDIKIGNNTSPWSNAKCERINGTIPKGGNATVMCDMYGRYVSVNRSSGERTHILYLSEVVVHGYLHVDCSECPVNVSCSPVTGCQRCEPGLLLPDCKAKCPAGLYGDGCSKKCGNCLQLPCNTTNGICDNKRCKLWFTDDQCHTHIASPSFEQPNLEVVKVSTENVTVRWTEITNVPENALDYYLYKITINKTIKKVEQTMSDTNTSVEEDVYNITHTISTEKTKDLYNISHTNRTEEFIELYDISHTNFTEETIAVYNISHTNFTEIDNTFSLDGLLFHTEYSIEVVPFRVWNDTYTEAGNQSGHLRFKTSCKYPESPNITGMEQLKNDKFRIEYENITWLDHGCDAITRVWLKYQDIDDIHKTGFTDIQKDETSFDLKIPSSNRIYAVTLIATNNENYTSSGNQVFVNVAAGSVNREQTGGQDFLIWIIIGVAVFVSLAIIILIVIIVRKQNQQKEQTRIERHKKRKRDHINEKEKGTELVKHDSIDNKISHDIDTRANQIHQENEYEEINDNSTEDIATKENQKVEKNTEAATSVPLYATVNKPPKQAVGILDEEEKKDGPDKIKEKKRDGPGKTKGKGKDKTQEKKKKNGSNDKNERKKDTPKTDKENNVGKSEEKNKGACKEDSKSCASLSGIGEDPEDQEESFEIGIELPESELFDNIYENNGPKTELIKLPKLQDYVREHKDNNNVAFAREFLFFPTGSTAQSVEGSKEVNLKKNRFNNIKAYDHSRVILKTVSGAPGSDYINANFVKDWKGNEKKYIATQGPKVNTLESLWRMVWEQKVNRIVMVTNIMDGGKKKCCVYWPETSEKVFKSDEFTIKLLKEQTFTEYIMREMSVTREDKTRIVMQFQYTGWPDYGVPGTCSHLLAMRKRLKSYEETATGPLVVHCSAGIGRTGTYIGLDNMLDQAEENGEIDIFKYTNIMREDRINMIQTLPQYIFLYDAVLEGFMSGTTAIPVDGFTQTLEKLQNDSNNPLSTQLEKLGDLTKDFKRSKVAAALEKLNVDKNRDLRVLPGDAHRPFLFTLDQGQTNYINAVYVDGFFKKNAFILTQLPLQPTIQDFWTLVFDYKIKTIVCLENNDDKSFPTFWPESTECDMEYGPLKIQKKDVDPAARGTNEFMVSHGSMGQSRDVIFYEIDGWPSDRKTPDSAEQFLTFIEKVKKDLENSPEDSPILVLCRNGAERSGLFCAAYCMLDKMDVDAEVDVFEIMKTVRVTRDELVQSQDQYWFLHQVALASTQTNALYQNL